MNRLEIDELVFDETPLGTETPDLLRNYLKRELEVMIERRGLPAGLASRSAVYAPSISLGEIDTLTALALALAEAIYESLGRGSAMPEDVD